MVRNAYQFVGFLSFFSSMLIGQMAFKEAIIKKLVNEVMFIAKEKLSDADLTDFVADKTEQIAQATAIGLQRAIEKGHLDDVIHLLSQKIGVELRVFKKETREHMWLEIRHELWGFFRYGTLAAIAIALPLAGYYVKKTVWPVFRKRLLNKVKRKKGL